MATYPTSPKWSYPVVRTLEFSTQILQGENGTEQRWALTTGKEAWSLTYTFLTLTQRNLLIAAFDAAKGAFDQALEFPFRGSTYEDVYFDGDRLDLVERSGGRWFGSVKLRQVSRDADAGTLGADFPALADGSKMQLPYAHGREWDTEAIETEGGRFPHYRRAAVQRIWSVGGSSLSDADADTIWSYFQLARGRYSSFGFTDPDTGTRYASCRFDSDVIERHYAGPNDNSIDLKIRELV